MKDAMACKSDLDKFLKHVGGFENVLFSLKLDGVRTMAVCHEDGTVQYFSRSKKEFPNFDVFDAELRDMAAEAVKKFSMAWPVVFDGEVCSKDKRFNNLMTQVRRLKDVDPSIFEFHLFDIWHDGVNQLGRYRILLGLCEPVGDKISVVYHAPFPGDMDKARLKDFVKRLVDSGEEGLVLKAKNGMYQHKRSIDWCKMVLQKTVDLKVIRVEPGTGKHEGKMGALVCLFNGKEVKVGTGFDDAQREEYLNNPPSLIEAKYRELTPAGSLRFPAFVRPREDKDEPSTH